MTTLLIGFPLVAAVLMGLLGALPVGVVGGSAPSGLAAGDSHRLPGPVPVRGRHPPRPAMVGACRIGKVQANHGWLRAPGVTSAAGAAGPMQIGIGGNTGNTFGADAVDGDCDRSAMSVTRSTPPSPPPTTCAATAAAGRRPAPGRCWPTTTPTGVGDKVLTITSTDEARGPRSCARRWRGAHSAAAHPGRHSGRAAGCLPPARHAVWGAAGDNCYDCGADAARLPGGRHPAAPNLPPAVVRRRPRLEHRRLQPGDLVFRAQSCPTQTSYHVGRYLGAGNIIAAPDTGAVVRIQPMVLADSIGAVRPTA